MSNIYYFTDSSVFVKGFLSSRTSYDGAMVVYKFATEQENLGEKKTEVEAREIVRASPLVWDGPPPGEDPK